MRRYIYLVGICLMLLGTDVYGFTIEGTIYEDFNILGSNDPLDVPIPNVNVSLVKDMNGNNILDSSDLWVNNTTTNSTGGYRFTLTDTGIFFIAVNSKTINTTKGLNSGYTTNDIWAEETYQTNDSNYIQIAPFFGGRDANISDDWDNGVYEHYVVINASLYNNESINFGFSFEIVVNTKDTDDDLTSNRSAQGTLRQFIQNAKNI